MGTLILPHSGWPTKGSLKGRGYVTHGRRLLVRPDTNPPHPPPPLDPPIHAN